MTPTALTIAGSDPSGGAGLQADLKTFHQHGVYGMSVVTLLTVQNTIGVLAVQPLTAQFVLAQLDAVLADIPPRAAKTGALGTAELVAAVAERAQLFTFPLIVDPVMLSKHGDALMSEAAAAMLRDALLPHAFLVTPNMPEAAALAGMPVRDVAGMERAAAEIAQRGPRNVLIKGGRLSSEAVDVLYTDGQVQRFRSALVQTKNLHGAGCVLSAAITARLARGETLEDAAAGAKGFVARAIRTSPGLGQGVGPVNLFAST